MKKTSTLALSMLLAAGTWCGLAYAAEGDTPATSDQETATFDFTQNTYGVEPTTSSNYYETTDMVANEGSVTLTVTGKYRIWKNDNTLRLYKGTQEGETNAQLDFTVTDGLIEEIVFTGKTLGDLKLEDGAEGSYTSTGASATWTGSADKVTILTNQQKGSVNINTIVVKYVPAAPDTRLEPQLLTNAVSEYTVVLGSTWYGPYFYTEPYGLAITYKSSNEQVLTFNEWGQPTIVGAGEATVTATTVATDEYKSVSKSYKVTVLPEGTVFSSNNGSNFTLAEPWSYDAQYGYIKATGFIDGANTESTGMAVSPEFDLDKIGSAGLSVESARN